MPPSKRKHKVPFLSGLGDMSKSGDGVKEQLTGEKEMWASWLSINESFCGVNNFLCMGKHITLGSQYYSNIASATN